MHTRLDHKATVSLSTIPLTSPLLSLSFLSSFSFSSLSLLTFSLSSLSLLLFSSHFLSRPLLLLFPSLDEAVSRARPSGEVGTRPGDYEKPQPLHQLWTTSQGAASSIV